MRDVLIIGGGPAGLIAGTEAAKAGADVLIVEEDPEVGKPDHCTGLVSKSGLDSILDQVEPPVLDWIKGVRIYSPKGKAYEVMAEERKACIIDRTKFDAELMRRAVGSGAQVVTGKMYPRDINEQSKLIINAEGTKSRLAKGLGFEVPKSMPAVQVDLDTREFDHDMVELHTGGWAPGFFAWKVPRGDHVRIGLASYKETPQELLQRMLERNPNFSRLKGAGIIRTLYGKVVVGGPMKRTVKGNAIAVGDAGGFVKSTTGGGVVLGGLVSKIAGRVAAESALIGVSPETFQRKWRRSYGRDFRSMRLASRIFHNMRNEEMERALKVSHEAGILGLIAGYDMDLQGRAVNRLLESRLIRFAVLPFLRSLF